MRNLLSNEDQPLPIDKGDRRSQDRENQSEIFPIALRMDTAPTISFWFLPNPENPEPKRSDEISSFDEIRIFDRFVQDFPGK
uniref:Uncharacterized protein n=1 Tax=Candidatus Kentrum sp. LFY TaxID=2126342 RepID=A0A450UKL1_9GAMM|nr:MAG: hypothetical protein BECKLFY1418A_GA0070994_102820 [Candidatus Kentron sp. LFY]